MGLLDSFDLIVIGGYLAGITTVGVFFYRKSKSLDDYVLGGRRMKWFLVGLSMFAADTSILSYLGYPAWSFRHDLKYNQIAFPYLIAVPIVIWLFLPIYSRGNLYTAYQYLERRFDLRVRLLGSVFFMAIRGAHVALIIYAPALMISALMGIPLRFSILAMGLLTAFYTAMGGIKSVIWTDAFQVGVIVLGFAVLSFSALTSIHGGLSSVWSVGMVHGKFKMFDFSPNFHSVDDFWALIIGGTIISVQTMSTDQAVLQKYFTTKSKRETGKSIVFFGLLSIPVVSLLSILGIVLFVFYQQHPRLGASLHNPDTVVPFYAAQMLPHGLAGLFVASMFAASMSTVSASLNSLSTASVVDIYQRLIWKRGSDRHYTQASRVATFLWGGAATAVALHVGRLGALIMSFPKIQSVFGGIILGIFLLGIISSRVSSTDVIWGVIAGAAVVSFVFLKTSISLYWYCVIGVLTTVVAGGFLGLIRSPSRYCTGEGGGHFDGAREVVGKGRSSS